MVVKKKRKKSTKTRPIGKGSRGSRFSPDLMREVQNLISSILLMTKWSQIKLADVMGVHKQTVSNWITGYRTPDTFRIVQLRHMESRIRADIKSRTALERRIVKEVTYAN